MQAVIGEISGWPGYGYQGNLMYLDKHFVNIYGHRLMIGYLGHCHADTLL